jgi:hypothetical protein
MPTTIKKKRELAESYKRSKTRINKHMAGKILST